MNPKYDISGQRFGKLTVLRRAPIIPTYSAARWVCGCECGNEPIVASTNLRNKCTVSCGCVKASKATRGGQTHTAIGMSWTAMMSRCFNEKASGFENYGGRGIKPCAFIAKSPASLTESIGVRPSGLSLDRMDNNLGYYCGKCDECISNNYPTNIRWATRTEQNRNQRSNRCVTISGETKLVCDWARESGVSHDTITSRLNRGWSGEDLISKPMNKKVSSTKA